MSREEIFLTCDKERSKSRDAILHNTDYGKRQEYRCEIILSLLEKFQNEE